MSRRIIEETFRAITPRGRRGIPSAPVISAGVTGGSGSATTSGASGGDLATSLSQAGQQISRLQSAYQQQASLISANTQAIQGNTSAQSSHSGSVAGQAASNFLGGALGFLSPVISGIASLFGGGGSTPAPLPVYIPPAPIQISGALGSATPASATAATPFAHISGAMGNTTTGSAPAAGSASGATQAASTPDAPQASPVAHVTVNVNAMDSQSFMDRSGDIANAVREAMLNMHPINNVIANL